jgi:AraC-like DNA-binding protein
MDVPPYLERPVPVALQPAVTRMWWLRMPSPERFERIVPIPAVHLIVNLGEPYRVVARGRTPVGTGLTGAFVSGVQLEYLLNENPAVIHHVGTEFAPWALPAFGIDPVQVAQRVVEADTEQLFPSVGEVTTLDELERFLLSRRAPRWRADHRILEAVSSMQTDPARPMGDLADDAGLTPKGFIALFRRHTGVTPKRFAEVCRHHAFLQQLPLEGPLPSWTELLAHAPYYDQPAFIHEFRRFTGMTPTAFLEHRRRYGAADPSFLPVDEVARG